MSTKSTASRLGGSALRHIAKLFGALIILVACIAGPPALILWAFWTSLGPDEPVWWLAAAAAAAASHQTGSTGPRDVQKAQRISAGGPAMQATKMIRAPNNFAMCRRAEPPSRLAVDFVLIGHSSVCFGSVRRPPREGHQ